MENEMVVDVADLIPALTEILELIDAGKIVGARASLRLMINDLEIEMEEDDE